ncbi:membrane protein HdeD [Marchantia polymorpha subsp. ruderalis]|uniref:Uncharacterized protein n=2 Tax=Marchantia polymorpha TaxID=3197 RepID=A0AAF6BZT4_MARPO|nr:hypothetical protein MARPO_0009s0204 [Marchantia polymorpha]BBN17518.1 hypothetical protein Mp_7g15200 [Marchantia polymorpha subsp. ruderalis]|eukprot:PTQ47124.1 hypothetical protein MARPO_0009s0204 [Marchantia polymorpha]
MQKVEKCSGGDHEVIIGVVSFHGESPIEIRIGEGCGDIAASSCAGQSPESLLHSFTAYYLFYLVGAVSIFIPFITGQGALNLLPWLLSFSGILALLQFSCVRKAPGSNAILLIATLHLTTGVWMLRRPRVSPAAVAYMIEVWFLIHGSLKLWISLQVRKLTTWPALFASGCSSIVLACVVHRLSPKYGLSLVDIYVRVELLFTGCASALLLYSIIAFLWNQRPSHHDDT